MLANRESPLCRHAGGICQAARVYEVQRGGVVRDGQDSRSRAVSRTCTITIRRTKNADFPGDAAEVSRGSRIRMIGAKVRAYAGEKRNRRRISVSRSLSVAAGPGTIWGRITPLR